MLYFRPRTFFCASAIVSPASNSASSASRFFGVTFGGRPFFDGVTSAAIPWLSYFRRSSRTRSLDRPNAFASFPKCVFESPDSVTTKMFRLVTSSRVNEPTSIPPTNTSRRSPRSVTHALSENHRMRGWSLSGSVRCGIVFVFIASVRRRRQTKIRHDFTEIARRAKPRKSGCLGDHWPLAPRTLVLDTLRIACANVETDLANALAPHLPRATEAKKTLANLFAAPGRIRVGLRTIAVNLAPAATALEQAAFQTLLATLNREKLSLPGDERRRRISFRSQIQ